MKNKKLLLIAFILIGLKVNAQNTFPSSGRVGIGISTPLRPLHVISTSNNSIPLFEGISNEGQKFFSFKRTDDTQEAYLSYTGFALAIGAGGNERVKIHSGGLQIQGKIAINTGVSGNLSSGSAIAIGDSDTGIKQISDGILAIYTNNVERFRVSNNGNVGIGITTPLRPLHVKGNGNGSIPFLEGISNEEQKFFSFKRTDNTQEAYLSYTGSAIAFGAGGNERLRIHHNGNIGIGSTSSPINKLTITGESGISLKGTDYTQSMTVKPNIDVQNLNPGSSKNAAQITNLKLQHLVFDIEANDPNDSFAIRTDSNLDGTVDRVSMVVKPSGNVGIGTTTPLNKLSVNGTIWAKEVKVSLSDAADWVFDDGYKLKPLAELENYIKENKHLPEIPSAEEFRKNDLKVSEITNKLLQKIEELTLYVIEQEKRIKELENKN